jgi:hypothetical protein
MNTAGRTWAVRVVFAATALHVVGGMLLPVIVNLPLLDDYHHGIAAAFWGRAPAPVEAIALQRWWMALFGPTVQAAAIWMGALAWIGARHRLAFAWGALIAGLLLWAPQDMAVSLQAGAWQHVWLDVLALAGMLPPLAYLVLIDRKKGVPC